MSKNRCCGNCEHFKDEDTEGWGWCTFNKTKTHCAQAWDCHNSKFNGWTEITPENVDEVRNTDVGRLIIAVITHGKPYYMEYREMFRELDEMAILGGYYYLVLPELKLEDRL